MAHKKSCRLAQANAKPPLDLVPAPRSAEDVVALLRLAAHLGMANADLVSHLVDVGAMFPEELMAAYRAFQERRACDN
jgi:hypothetical protein